MTSHEVDGGSSSDKTQRDKASSSSVSKINPSIVLIRLKPPCASDLARKRKVAANHEHQENSLQEYFSNTSI